MQDLPRGINFYEVNLLTPDLVHGAQIQSKSTKVKNLIKLLFLGTMALKWTSSRRFNRYLNGFHQLDKPVYHVLKILSRIFKSNY